MTIFLNETAVSGWGSRFFQTRSSLHRSPTKPPFSRFAGCWPVNMQNTRTCVIIFTLTHAHAHTHTSTHARTHARMHARTHACMLARTHAQTHTRTHACTHTRRRLRMRAAHRCSGLLAPMLSFDPAVQDSGEVSLSLSVSEPNGGER